MKKLLWEELNLDENIKYSDADIAYKKIKNKTQRVTFAWKVLRDKYYLEVYKKYKDESLLTKAGFFEDSLSLEEIDYYNINLLTTPFDKLKENVKDLKNPVVLLSTGGFYPIHDGHIQMMEEAKNVLTKDGYDVVGGYFSLSHEEYISKKPYYISNQYDRINEDREYIKSSNWLMIDAWESIYVNSPVNFTDVIERLEQYLQKHIDNRIKVAYVFGGDNVEFMYCFENIGLAVCVNRQGYNELFNKIKKIKNKNMYFIDNFNSNSFLSSRNIRKDYKNKIINHENKGDYLIRNESILPLSNLIKENNKQLLVNLQEEFKDKFIKLLESSFNNKIHIKVIDIKSQLRDASDYLKDKKTINLDSYFRGSYNLEVSRLFSISSYQDKCVKLVSRLGKESFEKQLKNIKSGIYTLVDDDSVSGRTLNFVKERLPNDVIVNETYLLTNSNKEKTFDVVDLRDFMVGVKNSGLVVKLPNGIYTRVPYVMPYVNLTTRASIPPSKEREFSIRIWQMNREFYQKYNKDFKLKDADSNFKNLMKYIGFSDEDRIIDICTWHIEKLSVNYEFNIR